MLNKSQETRAIMTEEEHEFSEIIAEHIKVLEKEFTALSKTLDEVEKLPIDPRIEPVDPKYTAYGRGSAACGALDEAVYMLKQAKNAMAGDYADDDEV